jgi:hypothetical protein
MRNLLQGGRSDRQWPLWLRLVAVASVLLICVMSTVQASHTHAGLSSMKQNSNSGNGPASDDHCPLCVAMHSALPVPLHVIPEPILHIQTVNSVAAEAQRIFRWRFEMASRPPPADQNVA